MGVRIKFLAKLDNRFFFSFRFNLIYFLHNDTEISSVSLVLEVKSMLRCRYSGVGA